ncbi:hypothetical protein LTR78_004086 [Recurvomyces mirabilis]|uniref:Carboxypeptidase n=1 Tax=Recurvomyces mirabilis TaxID=574656 RepID=A0AAE0WQE2_9PEZI|nr:hypothetical protein LTR78_004086 [Recurvomyces mirabilis]KAK5153741.1 hypothetical protein LTS14_007435 [Recurvomyces mirabilis]
MELFTLPPSLLALVACFVLAEAQYPPPASYQNILNSSLNPKITVAYKQPDAGTCTTAFSTQKQYTGYIGLPPYTLAPIQQDYSINTFFWFVESRQVPETSPLTIWLNGGPGSSSMVGFFNEVGPCEVIQTGDGSYGTQFRMYGWDRTSNMLFIDQPNQVGFSYDTATNASYDFFHGETFEPPTGPSSGLPGYMYMNGTFSSASSSIPNGNNNTANTTEIAAAATWHFLQTWLAAFPQYNPAVRPNVTNPKAMFTSTEPVGVNLFSESYGGKYGPVFARHFEQQNQYRSNGTLPMNSTLAIQLETVGIMNGLVDDLIQDATFPQFAFNNTYGIQAMDLTDQLNGLSAFSGIGGCRDQILACRSAMNSTDPEGYGDVDATNAMCESAQINCLNVSAAYFANGYDPYDIRQKLPSPDPPAAYQEYLNNASVLAAIGARVNYTESSSYVQNEFVETGDTIRGGMIEDLAYLLRQGIRVALVYGDADFLCNWYGGEAVSLAIAAELANYPASPAVSLNGPAAVAIPASYASAFPAAGYADIVVNNSYVGGVSRQFGNLSFSRIYDAGHFVPYFQPETAFTVFTRIIEGNDISTGEGINLSTFGSVGPSRSNHTNNPTAYSPQPTCWIRSWNSTCSDSDTKAMLAGSGVVSYGMFIPNSGGSVSLPTSSVPVGQPGHPVSSSSAGHQSGSPAMSDGSTTGLTGVYTATGTPAPTQKGGAGAVRGGGEGVWVRLGPVVVGLMGVGVGAVVML